MSFRDQNNIGISLVIPCYNEEDHLRASFAEIQRTMALTTFSYEIIFVDDASRDGTRGVILELERDQPNVRHIFHERNLGRGGAVKTGMSAARGRIAGFFDIDLEVHCRYIPSMAQAVLDGAEVVCGYRLYRVQPRFDDIFRNIISVVYRNMVRRLLRLPLLDTEAGFKFFDIEAVRPLLALTPSDGWSWDTEIMAMAAYRGYRIAEVPMVYERKAEKRTTVKPLRDSLEMLRWLLAFRRKHRPGPLYRSSRAYQTAMKWLYREHYNERLAAVAALIAPNATVLDVCCGDAALYDRHLRQKGVSYTGLDINRAFLAHAAARGIDARPLDIETKVNLPEADDVLMLGSLYQFIPRQDMVLRKLAAAARRRIIITEPVRNWSDSSHALLGRIGRWMTNPGTGPKPGRFDAAALDAALAAWPVLEKKPLCGGREMLYVLDATAARK